MEPNISPIFECSEANPSLATMFKFAAFVTSRFTRLVKKRGSSKSWNVASSTEKPPRTEVTLNGAMSEKVDELDLSSNSWRRRAGFWDLEIIPVPPVSISLSEDTTSSEESSMPTTPILPTYKCDIREGSLTLSTLLNSGSRRNKPGIYSLLGNTCKTVEDACQYHEKFQKALGLSLANFLEALADASQSLFEESGDPVHLDNSLDYIIRAQEETVLNGDNGDTHALPRLCHLEGLGLSARFRHFGDVSDISGAIISWELAVNLTPDGHRMDRARYLSYLGNSFQARFEHLEELPDLDAAIAATRDAIYLMADGDSDANEAGF